MGATAFCITAEELSRRGPQAVPDELVSAQHLIYSSPAALAFNSPGAQGFGVKRAGLAIPGSVMLLVSPGCCGRNTTILGDEGGYSDRMFYLELDETDIVTGRHLSKIPAAAAEICGSLHEKPSAFMVCITCVDALLGTDMERVCRKIEQEVHIPACACYMYALTREGIKPPMASVRESVYSLLKPAKRDSHAANILGFFAPLDEDCELRPLLRAAGVTRLREIGACGDFEEYAKMSEANFNLVLNPEARFAAASMEKRLGIPSIEITRMYQTDKIENQYALLGKALGVSFDTGQYRKKADNAFDKLKAARPELSFSIGESLNADPFELALALVRRGFRVAEIFGTVCAEEFFYISALAKFSPETKIYSNLSPSMMFYEEGAAACDVTLGRDAYWYHRELPNVQWNSERQPFGFSGALRLAHEIAAALKEEI